MKSPQNAKMFHRIKRSKKSGCFLGYSNTIKMDRGHSCEFFAAGMKNIWAMKALERWWTISGQNKKGFRL
jgi:hypothetical protein